MPNKPLDIPQFKQPPPPSYHSSDFCNAKEMKRKEKEKEKGSHPWKMGALINDGMSLTTSSPPTQAPKGDG